MPNRISSFEPIIAEQPKILILGTIPGVKSLEEMQYYAHPRNAFWQIIASYGQRQTPTAYDEKKELVAGLHIALWDVCANCQREGSLDSAIRYEEPNDITSLLKNNTSIRAVLFNGASAGKLFRKYFQPTDCISFHILPSTSPANTLSYEKKEAAWHKILREYLG